jgi:predicted SnoaL-like aldol condensation-catalyzing enzyme
VKETLPTKVTAKNQSTGSQEQPAVHRTENAMNRFLITLMLTGTLFLMGCQSPAPAPKAEEKAAAAPAAATPPPRKMTALPVVGYAGDQADLLKSSNPKLAANKKLAYDFFRIILRGRRLDRAAEFMTEDYIQHNPNADTGMAGFKAYFSALGGEQPIPEKLDGLVAIQADGDYVTLSFSREYVDPALKDETYTTTWFDMFRIVNGKIVEHWDSATKGPGPTRAPAKD